MTCHDTVSSHVMTRDAGMLVTTLHHTFSGELLGWALVSNCEEWRLVHKLVYSETTLSMVFAEYMQVSCTWGKNLRQCMGVKGGALPPPTASGDETPLRALFAECIQITLFLLQL